MKLTQKTGSTFSSALFSCSIMSNSFRPNELQHTRPPCPLPSPGVHSDSRPSSQWCHPAISSSVVPFISCPQSLPASESFPMSQLFAWGGQSTAVLCSFFFIIIIISFTFLLPFFFFSLFMVLIFNLKKSLLFFSTFIILFAFRILFFPLQLIFNVYKSSSFTTI